jgi:hypothetical protein
MAPLGTLIDRIVLLAPELLLVSTAMLALGAILVVCTRAPLHRQRIAESTVGTALAWFALALVPLPRLPLPRRTARSRTWLRCMRSSNAEHRELWLGTQPR